MYPLVGNIFDWLLIIEFYLISKNQNLNFVLFFIIIILKCICNFNAQYLFLEL